MVSAHELCKTKRWIKFTSIVGSIFNTVRFLLFIRTPIFYYIYSWLCETNPVHILYQKTRDRNWIRPPCNNPPLFCTIPSALSKNAASPQCMCVCSLRESAFMFFLLQLGPCTWSIEWRAVLKRAPSSALVIIRNWFTVLIIYDTIASSHVEFHL